jgi:heme exporter protein A
VRLVGDKLSSVRGGRTLFSGLSFAVASGESLLVMGPNGAGKTTLLRTIAGFMHPAAGRIALEGGAPDQPLGAQCHYVGHLDGVKASLTVAENARFWAQYLGGGDQRVEAALERFGLSRLRDIPADYLSAGQRRRLALARLVAAERPIWLLDEPSAALDGAAQDALTAAVNAHLGSGGVAVAATHAPLGFCAPRELRIGAAVRAA